MPFIMPAGSTSKILESDAIGPDGDDLRIHVYRVRSSLVGQAVDNTAATDQANTVAGFPFGFWLKQFQISGLLVSGSAIGLATLGSKDAGVPVTLQFETNHTVTGNLVVRAVTWDWKRKAKYLPVAVAGVGVGVWSETKTTP